MTTQGKGARPAVPFVDFRSHVAAQRAEIDAAIARVLDSGWFILGPEGEAFEHELAQALGAKDAVAVANGTEALQLALLALGVGPGDEVVTSPMSATFTALAVMAVGARPVFADVDPRTLNVDPEGVARAVTPRTKALLPVHLYGHPADMDPLLDLYAPHGHPDPRGRVPGHRRPLQGPEPWAPSRERPGLGALSFYPTKNLGALGDGGALVVNDPARAAVLRRLRNGGQSDRYRHEVAGLNSRLDEMQAAILRVGLAHLPRLTERRRELGAFYLRELRGVPGLTLPEEQPYARAVFHLFPVRHANRDALATALKDRGVGTLIHYPIPLHLQPALRGFGGAPGDYPVAEKAAAELLSLPLYPELSDAQAGLVCEAVRASALALS